ncbi:hypothetical protein BpHYR1_042065 [Brachionus plicatilis]|uniref:Uncharacterized protein n=1 Tax=Brachionus plicatilis TaxID=10195 RepID=A0A3M7SJC8_BRAPC|nr:hypothetical protein BpHYR1_042065 [Brachionus plicatilis]
MKPKIEGNLKRRRSKIQSQLKPSASSIQPYKSSEQPSDSLEQPPPSQEVSQPKTKDKKISARLAKNK